MSKHLECNGPCDQGRKACPTPWACEVEDPPEHNMFMVVLKDVITAVLLVGVIVTVLWGVMR